MPSSAALHLLEELVAEKEKLAKAVANLSPVQRKGNENVNVLKIQEEEESEEQIKYGKILLYLTIFWCFFSKDCSQTVRSGQIFDGGLTRCRIRTKISRRTTWKVRT